MLAISSRYNKRDSFLVDTEFFISDPFNYTYLKIVVLDDESVQTIGIMNRIYIDIKENMDCVKLLDYLRTLSRTARIIMRMDKDTRLFSYGLDYEEREENNILTHNILGSKIDNDTYRNILKFKRKELQNKYWSLYVFCPRYFS